MFLPHSFHNSVTSPPPSKKFSCDPFYKPPYFTLLLCFLLEIPKERKPFSESFKTQLKIPLSQEAKIRLFQETVAGKPALHCSETLGF